MGGARCARESCAAPYHCPKRRGVGRQRVVSEGYCNATRHLPLASARYLQQDLLQLKLDPRLRECEEALAATRRPRVAVELDLLGPLLSLRDKVLHANCCGCAEEDAAGRHGQGRGQRRALPGFSTARHRFCGAVRCDANAIGILLFTSSARERACERVFSSLSPFPLSSPPSSSPSSPPSLAYRFFVFSTMKGWRSASRRLIRSRASLRRSRRIRSWWWWWWLRQFPPFLSFSLSLSLSLSFPPPPHAPLHPCSCEEKRETRPAPARCGGRRRTCPRGRTGGHRTSSRRSGCRSSRCPHSCHTSSCCPA